jgi:type II restriction enzyme
LGQVKAAHTADIEIIPRRVIAAAWGPQEERMQAAIYFPLFLVLVEKGWRKFAIYYLFADLQTPTLFRSRNPLKPTARRAGWQGFYYETHTIKDRFVRLF